jgi:hypothetical protein
MYFIGAAGGAGFAGGTIPDGATGQDALPLTELQQANHTVGGVFHEGGHGTTGRTFAALETATYRRSGERLDFTDKIYVHRLLRDNHFFLFHGTPFYLE